MSSLVVGGTVIPVAVSSPSWGRMDAVDRGRTFDNTLFVSQAGGAAREWDFETPPVTTALADSYIAVLGSPAAKLCSGDILQLPTMCSPELPSGTPVRKSVGHNVVLRFRLHEVQPAKVLLRYAPGDTITGESFTRSTTARQIDVGGVYQTAAIDAKRDSHYLGGIRHFVREGASTNVVLQAENFGTTWTAVGTPTRVAAAHTAAGVTLDLIGDDDGAAVERYIQTITFTGDGVKALSVHVKEGTSTSYVINLSDTTAATTPFRAAFGWSGGLPVLLNATAGTYLGYETLAGGVFRIFMQTLSVIAANANSLRVYPATDTALAVGGTGDVYVGGVQAENAPVPSSYIPTTTATVTRGADIHSLPYTAPPGETSVYVKSTERGTVAITNARLWQISDAGGADPRFFCISPAGPYRTQHDPGAVAVTSTQAAAPAYGDTNELLSRLIGDGSVDSVQSINGAASTTSAQSAADPLGAAWSGPLCWLNSGAGIAGFAAIQSFKIVAGMRSLEEMRAL